jgi:hypothetical protein
MSAAHLLPSSSLIQDCGHDNLCYLYVQGLKTCLLCQASIVGWNRITLVYYLAMGTTTTKMTVPRDIPVPSVQKTKKQMSTKHKRASAD